MSANNYHIIRTLKDYRGKELTLEELETKCGINLTASPQLLQSLKENPAINYREDTSSGRKVVLLSWRSKYPFTSKTSLMDYMQEKRLLEWDPEIKLCYEDVTADLEELVREKKLFVIYPSKNKPIYFYNEMPQHKPMPEKVMQLWRQTFGEGATDMVGMRQQLEHKYRALQAQLRFDEDSFILQRLKEKKAHDEKLKAQKKRTKGRSVGPNVKKKVNEALSDMNFSTTISSVTDGVEIFTLGANDEEVIQLTAEDEHTPMKMPEVPPTVSEFVAQMIRAFCDDESIVIFEALLNEVSQGAKNARIDDRRETALADKLKITPRILRAILARLRTQYFARERIFSLPASESNRSTRQYSCWLITFNDLFDSLHYRLLKMLEIIDISSKDQGQYIFICSNQTCGRRYGIEDMGHQVCAQGSCLSCQSDLIPAETLKTRDEWSDVRPLLEKLQKQLAALLAQEGSKAGNTPELTSTSGSRRLPSSSRRGAKRGGAAAPRTPAPASSSSSTSSIVKQNGLAKEAAIVVPSLELVRKGDEKLSFDHPTPIQLARDGRVWLPVVYKTWTKKEQSTRIREEAKERILADLRKGHVGGKDIGNGEKRKKGKDKEKTSKRARIEKTEEGGTMDLEKVKQEPSEDEPITHPMAIVKSEIKLEERTQVLKSITDDSTVDKEVKRKRKMTQDEEFVSEEMKHREMRDLWWDWSYSTKEAHNFLCHVAELRKYYSQVLEFEVTKQSLYLAWKHMGITPEEVARRLAFLAGLKGPAELPKSIQNTVSSCRLDVDYFAVRIVLRNKDYFVDSYDPSVLKLIQQRVLGPVEMTSQTVIDQETGAELTNYSLPVDGVASITEIKKLLQTYGHTFIEEFDFISNRWKENQECANLSINLKPTSGVRDYQKRAAFSPFWDNKAHSAILVLPCGAGKTLVGITVASVIKKCILVFCTSMMAVNQWREQFMKWSDIDPSGIARFISDTRKSGEWDPNCGLLITTYNMFTSEKRSESSMRMIEKCKERTWGLMILDEVHLAPATTFKRVTTEFKAHVKLGLTATMVREDELIAELPTLVGPRLDEVDLLSLKIHNHVANVHCYRITCPLTPTFFKAYKTAQSPAEKRLLHITNPNKARIVFSLLSRHTPLGHKCLVFCDDLFGLQWLSQVLKSPYIDGETKNEDRESALQKFRTAKTGAYVLISKVGDHSIDLPEANVVIQIGVVDGSRMQEAQRLGRVQRKKGPGQEAHAYFYTIVSDGTDEVGYSDRRREFMEEHGYLYHEYDYRLFMNENTSEFSEEAKQEQLLDAVKKEIEKNPEGRSEFSELDDKPTAQVAKKKGTTRQRLTKKLNKRTGPRETQQAE